MISTHFPHEHHQHRAGHGPAPEDDADLAELLNLDAVLAAPVLAASLDAAVTALDAEPRRIVDLGAGTGTGTVALATRFPQARIHALDASPGMIEHVHAAAVTADVTDRVETHLVDLDSDWPQVVPRGVDVVWAALSLHHTTRPEHVLRQIFALLRPGGVLIVSEFTGVTTYDPVDLGTTSEGLGTRLVAALAARGYPVTAEWTTALADVGFADVTRRELPVDISSATVTGARYLALYLARNRELLGGELTTADLTALDAAVAALTEGTLPLILMSGRVFWVAVRPHTIGTAPATNGADR